MSDDKKKVGPADRSRINVNEDYELTYWADKFGVSKQAVKDAVRKVGVRVVDVEAELAK